jgi:methionyl aminopeptidase
VPNFADVQDVTTLTDGLVIAVEPIITTGCGRVVDGEDGWTIRTTDAAPVAHWEHTMVVTRGRPIVVTAL